MMPIAIHRSWRAVLVLGGLLVSAGVSLGQTPAKTGTPSRNHQLKAPNVTNSGGQVAPAALLRPVQVPPLTTAEKIKLIQKTTYPGRVSPESFGAPITLSILQPRTPKAMLSAQNVSFDISEYGGSIPMPSAPDGTVHRKPSLTVKLKAVDVSKSFLVDFAVAVMASGAARKNYVELQINGKYPSSATIGLPGNEVNPTPQHVTAVYTPTSKDVARAVTLSSTEDSVWWAVYSVEISELP